MEDVRLLLLIACLIILAGLFEFFNVKIEAYEIYSLNVGILSIIFGVVLILLSVYVIWKRFKSIELQREILEKGSEKALKEVYAKIENLKALLAKPSKKNLKEIKKEVEELKFYKGILSKILAENSKRFFEIIGKIEKTRSTNKLKKLGKELEEILS